MNIRDFNSHCLSEKGCLQRKLWVLTNCLNWNLICSIFLECFCRDLPKDKAVDMTAMFTGYNNNHIVCVVQNNIDDTSYIP